MGLIVSLAGLKDFCHLQTAQFIRREGDRSSLAFDIVSHKLGIIRLIYIGELHGTSVLLTVNCTRNCQFGDISTGCRLPLAPVEGGIGGWLRVRDRHLDCGILSLPFRVFCSWSGGSTGYETPQH